MVGALVLAVCTAPLVGSVAWIRACAADATIDASVAQALNEQFSLVYSAARTAPLLVGTVNSSKSLGNGLSLAIVRTVSTVSGKPCLYDVNVTGTWTSRGEGGKPRTLNLETYVFAPEN